MFVFTANSTKLIYAHHLEKLGLVLHRDLHPFKLPINVGIANEPLDSALTMQSNISQIKKKDKTWRQTTIAMYRSHFFLLPVSPIASWILNWPTGRSIFGSIFFFFVDVGASSGSDIVLSSCSVFITLASFSARAALLASDFFKAAVS